jgi:hypothetical protein
MRALPHRHSNPSAPAGHGFTRRKRATVEPMFPALIRAVAFFSMLSLPFFAALLIR